MQAVLVVVVVLVAHAVYLARSLAQARVRLRHLERFVDVLVGIGDLEARRAVERRAEDLKRLAVVELVQAMSVPDPEDDACTKVWTGPPAALVEAAARGAHPPSQATPRVALAMDVAPRAVASPPPLSRAAQLAAGLARSKSTRSPSWPSLKQHDGAASTPPPAGPAPVVAVARFPPTLLSMQAHSAPPHEPPTRREAVAVPARPLDDDSDATTVFDAEPPRYAARSVALRPPPLLAPLAHPDLSGSEDLADEATRPSLGPEEPTPPRGMRAAPLRPVVVQASEEGSA